MTVEQLIDQLVKLKDRGLGLNQVHIPGGYESWWTPLSVQVDETKKNHPLLGSVYLSKADPRWEQGELPLAVNYPQRCNGICRDGSLCTGTEGHDGEHR